METLTPITRARDILKIFRAYVLGYEVEKKVLDKSLLEMQILIRIIGRTSHRDQLVLTWVCDLVRAKLSNAPQDDLHDIWRTLNETDI